MSINWKNVAIFMAVLGPGIITANVDNDAGGIATYSLAGANFGYSLLWTLIPITILLIIVQEMVARMGVVTGKGLADLIRENFGVKTTFFVMIALILANIGNVIANFAGIAAAGQIFGISKYLLVPVAALGIWLMVLKGNYKSVEKIFLWACIFYVTYIISGFMAKPDWSEIAKNTFVPSIQFSIPYVIMLVGLIGTTIAPWMQFYLQSSIVEKGIKLDEYKYSKWDVIIGNIITDVVAFFIIVASAILFFNGVGIETVKDAAVALAPLAGSYATILFAVGLLNASIFAASIIPLSTAYYVAEAFGFESGVNKSFKDAPLFYVLYTLLVFISAAVILIPRLPLITVMYLSQVANGVLLPFLLIYMLKLVNKKRLMGEYVNSKLQNWISYGSVALIICLTLILVASYVAPNLFS